MRQVLLPGDTGHNSSGYFYTKVSAHLPHSLHDNANKQTAQRGNSKIAINEHAIPYLDLSTEGTNARNRSFYLRAFSPLSILLDLLLIFRFHLGQNTHSTLQAHLQVPTACRRGRRRSV